MTMGNLSNLGVLDLSYNKLSGSIPKELVLISSLSQSLALSNNFLYGPIPSQIGSFKNLGILNMAYNNLTGEIPTTIGECLLMEKLYLQGNFFQGKIPSSLSNLKGIQHLDLSNNNLSGPVPEFLASYELLLYLNLSFNNLVGVVPSDGIFRNKSAVSLIGNNNLCGGPSWLNSPPCPHADTNKTNNGRFRYKLIIIFSSIPIIIIFSLCAYCFSRRSRKKKTNNTPHEPSLMEGHEWISYFELRRITNGFSSENIIGTGSFGSVYKGILPDSREVAIKVLNLQHFGANKTFLAECEALRRIQHRNLIKLITICLSIDHNGNEFKALVFEFMPNGSLHEQLHSEDDTRRLSIKDRLDIVIGVAYALEYLHYRVEPPIAHCDLKPSNIFLDTELVVHVGDFGLARLLGNATSMTTESSSTIGLRGTIGYLAPEYGVGVKGSTEGDVYSFGVLLLEIITGKRPTDEMFHGTLTLPKFVEMAHPDQVLEIVDPNLVNDDEHGIFCAISLSRVGLLCTKELLKDRMNMQEVLHELLLIKDSYNKMNEQTGSAQ
ncbi:hypothetical protein LUZ60_002006 [Juncus effusus]|nr:hypothetical protein LUZ60_002006 [Juncus effusus]